MEHFAAQELACRCGCGLSRFHPGFLDELSALRREMGEAMTLNSACRCADQNVAVGGHPKSLHVGNREQHVGMAGTLAVDVATLSGEYRGRLFATAWRRGWSIGWNGKKGFLHIDRRVDIGLARTTFDY